MNEITVLHEPEWRYDDGLWLMIVGNRIVAGLMPNEDKQFPQYRWLSVVYADSPCSDHGWCSVDFCTLADGKYCLEQWWHHAIRGAIYREPDQ